MREPVRLSAVLITKNAEHYLDRCLQSLDWVDEIVVLDSGSEDNTLRIAKDHGARVFLNTDWPGFGRQRQIAQSYAQGEWILMIDTDEVITPELRQSIQDALASNDNPTLVYSLNRLSDFFGRFIRHSGWYPDRVVRLYARQHYQYDDAQVHEKLDCPPDRVRRLEGDLLHFTTQDFDSYMQKSLRYASDWAQAKARRGKRVSIAGIALHTVGSFVRRYFLQRGILDGRHGFLLAMQGSHYTFNKYFALWVYSQRSAQR